MEFEKYKGRKNSDFVANAIPMLEAAFHRGPVTKEKSPVLVANDIRHVIYKKRNKIYYQPGRRLVPDLLVAKLPYRMVDRLFVAIQKKKA